MQKERVKARLADLVLNEGQVEWLPSNPRQWTRTDIDKLKKSLQRDEDFQEDRPALAMRWEDKLLVFAGNLRTTAAKELKWKTLDTIVYTPESEEDKEAIIRRTILDNASFGEWDIHALSADWSDLPLTDWGVKAVWDEVTIPEPSEEDYERRKKEFEDRIAAGEIAEGDEEYQEFLEKFAIKKTTDDCYTPPLVYAAVEEYVAKRYGVDKKRFIRPFYPNGDYTKEKYDGLIVVDNPPFSIMAEILKFYSERNIPFFLFGPHLTLFSSSSSSATCICTGVPVIYENGASVNTSFLTNMEGEVRFRSAPNLYKAVSEAVEQTQREKKRELPKYSYDRHVVTTTWLGQLSRLGMDFSATREETEAISQLDSQKESGKTIFGKGYLISERKYAEREKAEREKAEREKAEVWELSARERDIIKRLK